MLRGISASSTSCRFHCPTNCTNSGSLVPGAQIVHSNEDDGKLALSLKKKNLLSLLSFLLIFEPLSTPHRAHIDPSPIHPSWTLHRSLIDPPHIDPTSSFRFKTIYLSWYQPWIVKLYTTTTSLLFFLHHHHHHISLFSPKTTTTFQFFLPPLPPPPHFNCFPLPPPLHLYCFPSTTTTNTTFPLIPNIIIKQ